MANAFVQKDTGGGTGTATTIVSVGITTSSGNLLIASAAWDAAGSPTATIADSKGNTWTPAIAEQNDSRHNQSMRTWYAKNITGGSAHTATVTLSATRPFRTLIVHEVSGADLSSPLGQAAADNAEAGTAVDTPAVTTTTNGEYIFAVALNDGGAGTFSPGTGFTERADVLPANAEMESEDQVQTTAGSIQPAWTLSNADDCFCQVLTFKSAAASSPQVFNSTGSFTAQTSSVLFEGLGGGGGGKSGNGGGGGGGEHVFAIVTGLTIGNSYTVTVAAAAAQNVNGTDSGFDDNSQALAKGGTADTGTGGGGGTGGIGYLKFKGGDGGTLGTGTGGGGGSGGGSFAIGANGAAGSLGTGGAGGTGVTGGGDGGAGGGTGAPGSAGTSPGGGGGGGATAQNGGAGATGRVTISWPVPVETLINAAIRNQAILSM